MKVKKITLKSLPRKRKNMAESQHNNNKLFEW